MNDGLLIGLVILGLVLLVLWRSGVRMTPWPEFLGSVALGLAIWLVLRAAGVEPGISVFLGFVAATILVEVWKRFRRRPI